MHIFVTGATGWVGGAVVRDLIDAGHRVTGLARSPEKAAMVAAAGATPLLGTLDDLDLLCDASAHADAVIHTAFDHDPSRLAASGSQERCALAAIGKAIAGFGTRLIVTSGVASVAPNTLATERHRRPDAPGTSRQAEAIARTLAQQGVPASIVRLAPTVHGQGEHGFIAALIAIARETGVSAYVGAGANRWPAVARQDAATLYRLVAERAAPAVVYHAIAEEGVTFRAIAEAIGRSLDVPIAARDPDHFGWLGLFVGADMPASSQFTRVDLGWQPDGATLLAELERPDYLARI